LSITDTGVLGPKDMEEERDEGMSDEMIAQEYFCSYDVGTLGNYYSDRLKEARESDRICSVPYDKSRPVNLYLDLGLNDSTSIIFAQKLGLEIHIIDFFEANNMYIPDIVETLRSYKYNYGHMYLPHDAFAKKQQSQKTIEQQFSEAGFNTERVANHRIRQGINEVRKIFPRVWFDKDNCQQLLRALDNYHKEYDAKAKVFRNTPKHDWSSHAADAMRYLAMAWENDVQDNWEEAAADYVEHMTKSPEDLYYEQAINDLTGDAY
jgi:hypothetical protein